jgi:hypothetical protein
MVGLPRMQPQKASWRDSNMSATDISQTIINSSESYISISSASSHKHSQYVHIPLTHKQQNISPMLNV